MVDEMPDGASLEGRDDASTGLGIVVIGRNEGARLVRCLGALVDSVDRTVYVDSGSTDDSVARARELGVSVVELDPSQPFTAARARNAGYEQLAGLIPNLEFVQFVDGDSELLPGWLEAAVGCMRQHPDVAVVCGSLRERSPDSSSWHRLAEMEWEGESGEIRTAGGNAMIRGRVFREVGGYDAGMIAGEDPELCVRIRRAGYRIVRLSGEMALHDANMFGFRQWWRRAVRDGHAYAEILHRQGWNPEPYWVRRVASILLWGGAIPGLSVAAAWPTSGRSLALLGALAILWSRIYLGGRRGGAAASGAALYASHCVLGKIAGFVGVLVFAWNRLVRRRPTSLIEHKS